MATWFQTTAIDYPNSRPHIGTAFEKLGADVQARYRRMEGFEVFFLMGNDENTVKVSKQAAQMGLDPQSYCDEMARQFRAVWDALDISYDIFIQTSSERHKQCCRKFIQKVYDNGYIYKGDYEGWYCSECEEFKTQKQYDEHQGMCPTHKIALIRRSEPCYYFRLSAFQERLLEHYQKHPEFIQPESRRNEIISLIQTEGLRDVNISRRGESWGIRMPFDPEFTIYVWFDALLTYITGIGYGDDEATFRKYWPANVHFIGKDITRFHCALWPAMLWAAGEEAPRQVFAHGFVYIKNEESGIVEKISKSLGNVIEPMEVISKFNREAFRYYFLRECPYPSDGEFSWSRFAEIYNSELANNLGNLLSRCLTLIWRNYAGALPGLVGQAPAAVVAAGSAAEFIAQVRQGVESYHYHQALQATLQHLLTPTNQYLEAQAPWKLVKTDPAAAAQVLARAVESLRVAAIVLKPFLPRTAAAIYESFNFQLPWDQVRYADAAEPEVLREDRRAAAPLVDGKPKPLFPRIELDSPPQSPKTSR
ncbi:methionine--tRNA ligase [Thermogemmata fonticola]|uniref:Methionine--tRNA ligase n=1 Tax=Thermogemmata fonticola TaxID=2755323 RepID=A0A7V9ABJ5_9BACT|nr:methionine--tRNA ligase [Thermogemmata fonticola]MBA2225999.1 methionine--tRNA ligase [Thermogemmata fonticola]